MEQKKNSNNINEESKKMTIEEDRPPEFDITEFGVAIKNFYKYKRPFSIYFTLAFLGIVGLIIFLVVLNQYPFAHNTYYYYLNGNYISVHFNLLEFLGLGNGRINVAGTCTPLISEETGNIINGYEYNLCSGASYFFVTSFNTLVIQFSLLMLIVFDVIVTLLAIKHWKLTYKKAYSNAKGYVEGNKLVSKLVIVLIVGVVLVTILAYVLSFGTTTTE